MGFTDIKTPPLMAYLPGALHPFAHLMRLDRPIGFWLLLTPCVWSVMLAAGGVWAMNIHDWQLIGLFALGAFVMRPAGCIINDLWDRKLDQKVERTAQRPLASGAIKPWQALLLLAILLSVGLYVLMMMNITTILLGILAVPFVVIYPLMKRLTWWPQAFLGLTFNFGALMGWSAVTATLEPAALLLYVSCFFWTLGYDTIYAHQDREDDALIGIKSTARLFQDKSRFWVGGFYVISVALLCASFALTHENWLYGLAGLPALVHLLWQVRSWDLDNPESALKIFRSNRDYGIVVLILICLIAI